MARGTKRLSRQQLEDELTRLDVEISGSNAGAGVAQFQVRAKKSTMFEALELLRQILREPALDAAELELMKAPQIAALEQARTDPQSLATDLATRLLSPYPADDIRYTPPAEEEIAQIKAVTIDQVRKLYSDYLGAVEGEFIAVGDFDPGSTLKLASETLGGWKAKQPVVRIESVAFLDVAGRREAILTPDKANAVYYGGEQLAMNDQDANYPALVLGSYVLGGSSLSSRLGDRVRQKEGLSYGVGSFFFAGSEDKVAQFMLYAIANPANVPKVEKAIREEIDRLLKDGIPAEEFGRAQQGLLQSRELSRSSDTYVIGRLRRSLRMDQTLAFDEELDRRLAALKATEVQAALKEHFDPERLVIVVAGDFESAADSK
jgi:zinc protease